MKVLLRHKALKNVERYDLNETYCEQQIKGLSICYSLATNQSVRLTSMEVESRFEEVGQPQAWRKRFSKEVFCECFSSFRIFASAFNVEDFGRWTLNLIYHNVPITVTGTKQETIVGVIYPNNAVVNMLLLLKKVEDSTYRYNSYDPKTLALFTEKFGFSTKHAVLNLQKFMLNPDIFGEFLKTVEDNKYPSNKEGISVGGWTAMQLSKNYKLSLIGVYNYLIFLRAEPEKAQTFLSLGLPRK